MKRAVLVVAAALAGCTGGALTGSQKKTLEPLGGRAEAFEEAALKFPEAADREAFLWLASRLPRRATLDARMAPGPDLSSATPEFLALRVARARAAQAEWPWAPREEDRWRRGVLMYRVATEQPSDWAQPFLADEALVAAVRRFRDDWPAGGDETLRRLVHFLNAEWLAPRVAHKPRQFPELSPAETLAAGGGRSTDLAILAVCLLRTFGVPAALARTPCLAGSPSGDAWVSILGTDHWIRPADPSPITDSYFRYRRDGEKLAKVYVGDETDTFAALDPWVDALSFYHRYHFSLVPASDATRSLDHPARLSLPALPEPSFLAVFGAGSWMDVAPGLRAGDTTDFGWCGAADILYLPTRPHPEKPQAISAGHPFVLHPDGSVESLPGGPLTFRWIWQDREDGASPAIWDGEQFVKCSFETSAGVRRALGAKKALYIPWKDGRENGGKGKPAGRPFTVDDDGRIREF